MVAEYLDKNYDRFFNSFTTLILSNNYVTKRQSLKLLGEILLDRANFNVMTRYIANDANLKMMMNLLRDKSKNIQFEAFHVFKVFVANPKKPPQIEAILRRNKEKLLVFLKNFHNDKDGESPACTSCRYRFLISPDRRTVHGEQIEPLFLTSSWQFSDESCGPKRSGREAIPHRTNSGPLTSHPRFGHAGINVVLAGTPPAVPHPPQPVNDPSVCWQLLHLGIALVFVYIAINGQRLALNAVVYVGSLYAPKHVRSRSSHSLIDAFDGLRPVTTRMTHDPTPL
jgi:hypothetical protein